MRQRGRKTAETLVALAVNGKPPRLKPPAGLSSLERELFIELVEAVEPAHFISADLPLLISFIQTTLLVRSTANQPDQIAVWEKALKLQVSLATKLRLTPSSRIDPKTLARQQRPPLPRPWEEDHEKISR
jgi:hypothetical protein